MQQPPNKKSGVLVPKNQGNNRDKGYQVMQLMVMMGDEDGDEWVSPAIRWIWML